MYQKVYPYHTVEEILAHQKYTLRHTILKIEI